MKHKQLITHYDLFAGIGGFSLAIDEVFNGPVRHIFCEWEQFPTAVLRQHWPNGEFWGDIAELVTDTKRQRLQKRQSEHATQLSGVERDHFTIVTGGFPCQPFSAAGRRQGTADDRYQWPNMFEVIRNVKPEWVVAENVRGLITWNDGMVLETICTDLEAEGYEVQPFIIPAVAVGAPHRRDRVWIIGHKKSDQHQNAQDTISERMGRGSENTGQVLGSQSSKVQDTGPGWPDWSRNWQEVAFATCDDQLDDGLPRLVDGVSYSRAKWRKDSLKAYGNAIVPQVAIEIMRSIQAATGGKGESNKTI